VLPSRSFVYLSHGFYLSHQYINTVSLLDLKRSVIKERHLELLVVADQDTLQWHANQDIESYILTLITMVSRVSLFVDNIDSQ